MIQQRTKYVVLTMAVFLTVVLGHAQSGLNSPFTRFGLGNLQSPHFAALIQMGGIGAAYRDAYSANLQNPASLGFLEATSFQVGLNARLSTFEESGKSQSIWSGGIDHISLSFPLVNAINKTLEKKSSDLRWGMGLSLSPYSLVGYNIQSSSFQNNVGGITQGNQGTGGTYRFHWTNGLKYKNWAFGLDIAYFFGKIENAQEVFFDDLAGAYVDLFDTKFSVSGVNLNLGVLYEHVLDKNLKKGEFPQNKLLIGAYYSPSIKFTTKTENLFRRGRDFSFITFEYTDQDTLIFDQNITQSGRLPASYGIGIMYEKRNKFRGGIDLSYSNWSEYENEAQPDELENSFRIAAGVEYTPDVRSYNNYFKRMKYRGGLFYNTDPRRFTGGRINQFGLTLGAGFPLVLPLQQVSFVNLGVTVGKQGNDKLDETFIQFNAGFTLNNNRWFLKRKFN